MHPRRRTRSKNSLRPALERIEARDLPSVGAAIAASLAPSLAFGGLRRHGIRPVFPTPTPTPSQLGTLRLVGDTGTLTPPFIPVQANGTSPTPGAVYNLSFLTVRNGTSQSFAVGSGFTVGVAGQPGTQAFPTGKTVWKPNTVIVFYTLSNLTFPPSFTFHFRGSPQTVPANIRYNVQFIPNTFPGVLNSIASQSVGGRYRLV
jgi:hypothetical protein